MAEMSQIIQDDVTEIDLTESLRIGAALLKARRLRSWSIKTLASASGLSTGMISQIERGRSLPSLKSLAMLASALSVPIGHFFNSPEPSVRSSSIYVIHQHERPTLKLTPTGLTKQHLTPDLPGMIDMFEVKLSPSGSSGPEFYPHEGEKAGVVLSGRLRLWINDEPTLLDAGDSFRFPSNVAHRFDNPGDIETHLIWILVKTEKHQLHL